MREPSPDQRLTQRLLAQDDPHPGAMMLELGQRQGLNATLRGPRATATIRSRYWSSSDARNLGERLALDGPEDEFKVLGHNLDDLLARLQTAFDAQQQHFRCQRVP